MKLPESNKFVVSNVDTTNEKFFALDESNSGLLFEILRSKLYSDPIGSICREISSNSRDANREVGKHDVPIEIGWDNDNLYFQDNGPGISPDRMDNVFIKYAASTKRDSNEFTGGWGLGCKTPFAYSDTFFIDTVVNGVKYSYIAVIDETKKGKIIKVSNENTSESNGTRISIPVESYRKSDFEEKVIYYTRYWSVLPVLKNFRRNYVEFNTVLYSKEFKVVHESYPHPGNHILIDEIPYPLPEEYLEAKYYYSTLIEFNNNELSISANREHVHFDDKSKAAIRSKVIRYKEYLTEQFNVFIKEINTLGNYDRYCVANLSVVYAGSLEIKHFNMTKWDYFRSMYFISAKTKDLLNVEHFDILKNQLIMYKYSFNKTRIISKLPCLFTNIPEDTIYVKDCNLTETVKYSLAGDSQISIYVLESSANNVGNKYINQFFDLFKNFKRIDLSKVPRKRDKTKTERVAHIKALDQDNGKRVVNFTIENNNKIKSSYNVEYGFTISTATASDIEYKQANILRKLLKLGSNYIFLIPARHTALFKKTYTNMKFLKLDDTYLTQESYNAFYTDSNVERLKTSQGTSYTYDIKPLIKFVQERKNLFKNTRWENFIDTSYLFEPAVKPQSIILTDLELEYLRARFKYTNPDIKNVMDFNKNINDFIKSFPLIHEIQRFDLKNTTIILHFEIYIKSILALSD